MRCGTGVRIQTWRACVLLGSMPCLAISKGQQSACLTFSLWQEVDAASTCYCFEKTWSTTKIDLDPEHLYPSLLCGVSSDSLSSPEFDCSEEGTYPTSIYDNPSFNIDGPTSTTGLGEFISYAPDVHMGSVMGLTLSPQMIDRLDRSSSSATNITCNIGGDEQGARSLVQLPDGRELPPTGGRVSLPGPLGRAGWEVWCNDHDEDGEGGTRHIFRSMGWKRVGGGQQGKPGQRCVPSKLHRLHGSPLTTVLWPTTTVRPHALLFLQTPHHLSIHACPLLSSC